MQPNLKNITRLHGLYLCGMSLAKLSKVHGEGLSRQRLYYYFKMYRLPLRSKTLKEVKVHNGSRYSTDKDGYWRKTNGNRELLHRRVWLDEGNIIPNGHAVIFKDRDKNNCDLSNLQCVPLAMFGDLYSTGVNQYTTRSTI